MSRCLISILVVLLISSCSIFGGQNAASDDIQLDSIVRSNSNVDAATSRELELKLAKLWAKVDELEQQLVDQRQKVRILEKGLMLGIIPEELKNDAEVALRNQAEQRSDPVLIEKANHSQQKEDLPPASNNLQEKVASATQPNRDEILRDAQGAFEQGRYGRAIALYSQLQGEPGNSQDYWIALSWFRLKEYESAHKHFTDFIHANPESPWIARAKYHLARVEYELGYRERAVSQMREVINSYPNEDAAQMARSSIQSWERSL